MEVRIPIEFTAEGYKKFLMCKKLPRYEVVGKEVITDKISYASIFGGDIQKADLAHSPFLLDFQEMITEKALLLHRYAILLDCGLGKTAIELAWAHSVAKLGKVLILCPLSVFKQMQRENKRWFGDDLINLRKKEKWNDGIAILNYEGRYDLDMKGVAGVILDESSILKNATGATRNYLIDLVKNVDYRLSASATPAPNDYDEYASQAVFLGLVKTAKEFYARYFRREGSTWNLKGYGKSPFYEYLSLWAAYIKSPSSLGYDGMTEMKREPEYVQVACKMPDGFRGKSGQLVASADNAKDRSLVFGALRCDPKSDRSIKMFEYMDNHKTIVWCNRNKEEAMFKKEVGDGCVVINGAMPVEDRVEWVDKWRAGEIQHLISKPSVLGFGINLPEAERMIYSGFNYSFEQFYQAVRRSHRYGRKGTLKVMLPYTWPELPILESLKRKMNQFESDVQEIQKYFNLNGRRSQ